MIKRYDVLCVGSATVDHFLTVGCSLKKIKLGDKILVKGLDVHSGGGATNSGAALSKLGLKVKILTKLGGDHEADFIVKELKDFRLKNICLHRSRKKTDFATLVSCPTDKDRIIYVHKGASKDLSLNDFKKGQLRAKWIYLATLVGGSFKVAKEIARYAGEKKINLLFNPSLYLAEKGQKYLKDILEVTKVLVLNREEARALLGVDKGSFKELLDGLLRLGPETVVITDGPRKLMGVYQGETYSLVPPKVKVVHTAGSGDAFTSGLLAGMIKGYDFEEALKLGVVNAASVIGQVGTKKGLLREGEALRLVGKYKLKVKRGKVVENKLYILPFDHRSSFKKIIGVEGKLTKWEVEKIKDYKQIIYSAFKKALKMGVVGRRDVGILVDETYGKEILLDAKKKGIITCYTLEKSGQEEFHFDHKEYKKRLKIFEPTYAKVLVRYNPEGDIALNRRQAKKLAELSKYLKGRKTKFLLEVLEIPTEKQKRKFGLGSVFDQSVRPKLMIKAIRELQEAGVDPEIWKLEGLSKVKDMENVVEVVKGFNPEAQVVVLGRGESKAKAEKWLRVGAKVEGVRGFAVGRTVFKKPLEEYNKKKIGRQEAERRIAENYVHFVKVFERARGGK